MGSSISVGLGEIKISTQPDDVLVAYGIGSCLAIGMYDPKTKVGGLLHAVLPEFSRNGNGETSIAAKYVDAGIAELLGRMEQQGAIRSRLVIRIAGGANMLTAPGFNDTFNIGQRNLKSAHETLTTYRLKTLGEETGGNAGRTVRLYVGDGRMTVRSMGKPEREF